MLNHSRIPLAYFDAIFYFCLADCEPCGEQHEQELATGFVPEGGSVHMR
jgi:hypothetical protein